MNELTKIASRFGKTYHRVAKTKLTLSSQQQRLFAAFDQEITRFPLGRLVVQIPDGATDIDEYISLYYPDMTLIEKREQSVILEVNPSLQKFTFVNPDDGLVYGRTIAQVPGLDDERLQNDDPELWERITVWPEPWLTLVKDTVRHMGSLKWSEESLDSTAGEILRHRGLERVLKPFNTLNTKDFEALEEYLLPGSISVRLVPPRTAKPEELEELNYSNE